MKRSFFLILIGLVSALVLSEIFIRLLPEHITGIDYSIISDIRIFDKNLVYKYKPNSTRVWTGLGSPTVWHFNNLGYRERSLSPRNKIEGNIYRIAFVGDSIVMGLGVEENEAIPHQLERLLQPKTFNPGQMNYEVSNFGIWGYGIKQYVYVVKQDVVKIKPDLIIIGFFENDTKESAQNYLNRKYLFWKSLPDNIVPYRVNEYLKQNSRFYLFVLTKFYSFIEKNVSGNAQVDDVTLNNIGWRVAEESIKEIVDFSKHNNVKAVLVGFPSSKEVLENQPSNRIYYLSGIAERTGIEYLDLYEYLVKARNKNELFIGGKDNHYTPYGSEFIAKYLYIQFKEKWL